MASSADDLVIHTDAVGINEAATAVRAANTAETRAAEAAVSAKDAKDAAAKVTNLVNALDDADAALKGVAVGGLYHNSGAVRLRLV